MTIDATALTCREVADFVADYLGDALEKAERARFEEHLAECPECVTYLRSYSETMRLAKDAYADPATAAVPEQLVRAILAARSRRGWRKK